MFNLKNIFKKEENVQLSNVGYKYFVSTNKFNEKESFSIIDTEDIFKGEKYIAKLIAEKDSSYIYIVAHHSLKERRANQIIKTESNLKNLFNNIPKKITIKHTTYDGLTEYENVNIEEFFNKIDESNLTQLKPIIFPKFFDLEDIVGFMDSSNGEYAIVNKK